MYVLRYLTLISCLALAMSVGAQQPKESHMKETPSKLKWVSFDVLSKNIRLWRDDGGKLHRCYIMDWNIMAKPHPVLEIMLPPPNIHSPIRISFRFTWTWRPDYWMGINGVHRYSCTLRVKNKKPEVRLVVYE